MERKNLRKNDLTDTSIFVFAIAIYFCKIVYFLRERDFLKTTLHRIYGKFLGLRAFIRYEYGLMPLSLSKAFLAMSSRFGAHPQQYSSWGRNNSKKGKREGISK